MKRAIEHGIRGALAALLAMGLGVAPALAADAKAGAVLADKAALAKAVAEGRKAASFCFNCHGEDGNSKLPEVPNLAAQNASYLTVQIGKFASGERSDAFMQGLVKALSEEERANIAVFFSQQPLKKDSHGGGNNPAGKGLYERVCVACHGPTGAGDDVIPRIAGQQRNYVVSALTRYRNKDGRRDPRMSEVAAKLSPADINAVASFVAAM